MKFGWKRLLLTTMAIGLFSTNIALAKTVSMNLFYNGKNHAYKANEVKIMIDGTELVTKDMPAVIIDGRTMLPMRVIAQELGCEVIWNDDTNQAFIINDSATVGFTINSKKATKNGESFSLDVPAMIVNERTMLPVRALATALDLEITWDDPNRTVYIGEGAPSTPSEPETPPVTTPPTSAVVKVNKISVPTSSTGRQVFTIEASAAMSKFEEIYVDDTKIVLDIQNATNGLSAAITSTNSSLVTAIRTAQHDTDGIPYTRVVLDLAGKKDYTVTQSSDKKQILVTFEKVMIDDISLSSHGEADRLVVSADGSMGAKVSTLTNPQRIVVDIPNVESEAENELDTDGLSFVTAARANMYTADTLRIVLEVSQLTEYSWEEKDGDLTVNIKKSTLENMTYDSNAHVLELKKMKDFDVKDIQKRDQYLNGYYEIVLPGNYEEEYGYGTLNINDDVLSTMKVETKGGETVLRFNQSRISEYTIEDKGDVYAISVKNPKEVYDKVLLLDAGHGGNDPGTNGNGLTEKAMNLTIMLKVNEALKNSGIKVYLTRDGDTRPDNNDRAKTANQIADLMVSIHMNAALGNTSANGTETLFQVHSNDNASKLTSRKAAEIMQSHVVTALSATNRGVKQRTDLLILNATTVPTVLLETCFLSNPGDALKISNTANQNKVAQAIADAIVEMMGSYRLR